VSQATTAGARMGQGTFFVLLKLINSLISLCAKSIKKV